MRKIIHRFTKSTVELKAILIIVLSLQITNVKSQHSYGFQVTQEAYADLINPTIVPSTSFDPSLHMYLLTELNAETFTFYSLPFTFGGLKTFAIEPNATVRIDNDSSLIIIDGAFTYLDSVSTASSVSYVIEGTPGNYLVKCQWKDLKVRVGQQNNFVNLQIWIYQSSNLIEVHYGPRSANNASGFNTTSGPQVGMFYSRDNFSRCYEKLWVTGSPSAYVLDSAANYNFLAMSGIPDSGTVYKFTPRFGSTKISEVRKIEPISIFPNPASGSINISVKENEIGSYRIVNSLGEIVRTGFIAKDKVIIDISEFKSGVYELVIGEKESVRSQKFIKQ